MKILLTGANGFIGDSIKKKLVIKHSIFELSRTKGNYKIFLEHEIPDFKENYEIVIHTAGKVHSIPKSIEENNQFYEVNVKGTLNLLKGLENVPFPKTFIFISSVAVYGIETGIKIDEKHPLLAKDPYGGSKIQAEELVMNWCAENNVICTILRLPLLVGENPPGNLGAMIHGIKKGYYFNIAGGLARKSMVLVEDVANILLKVSEIGGIYNLTDGAHPNFYELSNAIAKQYGKSKLFNLPFAIAKSIALVGDLVGAKFPLNSSKLKKITSDLTFDDSKAKEVLGWNPKKVLDYYNK